MVERRDCHVTRTEIQEATRATLKKDLASNKVQHFWTDGILETGIRYEEVSIPRRKVLLCLAEAFRRYGAAETKVVTKLGETLYGIDASTCETELRDLQRRRIIVARDDGFEFKVPLFREWLIEKGINEIITTFSDLDDFLQRKRAEEAERLKPEEVESVIEKWGFYRGQRVTESSVRRWLSQFGESSDQRLMLKLLSHLQFYTSDLVRGKMKEAHGIVSRSLERRSLGERRKRSDIIVSYVDGPAKSGAHFARLYADENEVYFDNVVEYGRIAKALAEKQGRQALVFVDDFMGTGTAASEYFRRLVADYGRDIQSHIQRSNLRLFFVVVCAFEKAQMKLDGVVEELNLPLQVHICDSLDESARCFSDRSSIFPEPALRERARQIAYLHGARLENHAPLGYGDCQATLVFESNCPNNSLPILWAESKDWRPLFKRV